MEMWARCEPCSRDFFVPDRNIGDLTRAACDVCGASPTSLRARVDDLSFEVELVPPDTHLVDVGSRVLWLR